MKKLLSLLIILFPLVLFAQDQVKILKPNVGIDKISNMRNELLTTEAIGPVNQSAANSPKVGTTTKVGNSVATVIGHSANVFTSVGGIRPAINYNPDINTVSFVYRQDPAEYGGVGASGWVRYSVSQDDGATWTENNGILWDNGGGSFSDGRYPIGILYNPPGNTDPDEAYQFWAGPTLTATNGASWGGVGYGSLKIGDAGATATNQGEFVDPINAERIYIPQGGGTVNDKIYIIEAITDATNATDIVYQDSLAIYIGDITGGTLTFNRTKMYFPVTMDGLSPGNMQIAFAPDGQIGYMVGTGRLDSAAYPKKANNLIYMKTTDGGVTWGPPQEFYFADDTAVTNNIGDSLAIDNIASAGGDVDIVVDSLGNPHCLFNVDWRPNSDFGFVFVGAPSTIWHTYSPDGGVNWVMKRVSTTNLKYGGIGTPAEDVYQENRPQLSRDETGRYVLMAWFDTDTSLGLPTPPCEDFDSGYCGNSDRSLRTRGYNVVKDFYSDVVEYTNQQHVYQNCFEYVAELSIKTGTGISMPYTYQVLLDKAVYLTTVDHYYESEVSWTYEALGDSNVTSIQPAYESYEQFSIYPNPANTEIRVGLEMQGSNLEIMVVNILGQIEYSRTFSNPEGIKRTELLDISQLDNGLYFLKVGKDGVYSTQKFIKE